MLQLAIHWKSLIDFRMVYLHLILTHSKSQNQQIRQILQLSVHGKLPICFASVYLRLTLIHSKGQSQGQVNFDYEYLVSVTGRANITTIAIT